jgi:hypothetical protein
MLCEQVIIEAETRNVTPVNCFSRRTVDRFPSEAVPFVVFAILSDGQGEMPLDVVVSRLDNLDIVYRRSVQCRFTDPLQAVRCIFRIRDCSFPTSGHYQVSLLADRELVAQRKLVILWRESLP